MTHRIDTRTRPRHTKQVIRFVLLVWVTLFALTIEAQQRVQEPTVVRYFSRGNTEGLRSYQLELIKLALEKTRHTFGDYSLIIVDAELSAARAKAETEKGELINAHYSTEWSGEFVNIDNVFVLDQPILKGLLGMRSLIVRADRLAEFEVIKSHSQLTPYRAGQRSDWPDTEILRRNQIPVVGAELFDPLSPMLQAQRFDYLPLSILEAPPVVKQYAHGENALAISATTAIYYPLDMHLCISKNSPHVASRISQGLTLAEKDGSMNNLFNKHFGFVHTALEDKKLTTLVINNPLLSQADNDRLIAEFTKRYGAYTQIIYPPKPSY